MKRKLVFNMLLLSIATSACATVERPAPADTACLALKAINFAQLPPGETDDIGNRADSDETVDEIMKHNASWENLCRDVFDGAG